MPLPDHTPEFRRASEDWWVDNVRIVDGDGNVDSSWYVSPGASDAIVNKRCWEVLRDYRAAEPEAGWHLETRGTVSSWHDWEL